ncbi:uncharacterized protein MONOS_12284 [Monocercomonoides exilis]|uniref:uncharacterized protein n=1 Tax=Monocercomonoides exilis TaxID=2049356 RepID=UPI00355A405B|nr:hypothetical protein MONOS_12284 [Monocercomonoides exilis]
MKILSILLLACLQANFCAVKWKDKINWKKNDIELNQTLSLSARERTERGTIIGSFTVQNTTLECSCVILKTSNSQSFFRINEQSILFLMSCAAISSSEYSFFVIDGGVTDAKNLSISSIRSFAPIPGLFCSSPNTMSFHKEAFISLSDSLLSSFEMSKTPLLAADICCSVSATCLFMHNITSTFPVLSISPTISVATWTTLDSCIFHRVSDVIDGGITRSVNSPFSSLAALNITLESCMRQENIAVSNNKHMTQQRLDSNDSHVFTDCEWHDINVSGVGSAIYLMGGSTLKCTRCSFRNMSQQNDGAVDVQSGSGVNMTECNFSNCKSGMTAGGMILYKLNGNYQLLKCIFSRCIASTDYGGGIRLHQNDGTEKGVIHECKFKNNEARTFGGGSNIQYHSFPYIFSDCLFSENLANGTGEANNRGGGGISLYSTGWMNNDPPPIIFSFCLFIENKARCNEGHDIKISDSLINVNPFESSYSTTPENRVHYNDSGTAFDCWLPTIRTTYCRANSISETICGLSSNEPCGTIEKAFNSLERGAKVTVHILNSIYSPLAMIIDGGEASFEGESADNCIINTSSLDPSSFLFTLTSGSMKISLVTIRHNSADFSASLFAMGSASQMLSLKSVTISGLDETAERIWSNPLFRVIFAKFQMDNCLVEHIALSSRSLFEEYVESGTRESMLMNVTFSNISKGEGNGGIFSASRGRSDSIWIKNVTFKNCSCSEGNGGCIDWSLMQGGSYKIGQNSVATEIHDCGAENGNGNPSGVSDTGRGGGLFLALSAQSDVFEIVNVVFNGNHAEHGRNVFIASNHLELIPVERFAFVLQMNEDASDAEGIGDASNASLIVPILCYTQDVPQSGIQVSASGADHPRCGFSFFKCRTLSFTVNRANCSPISIIVKSTVDVGETVVFSKTQTDVDAAEDGGLLVIHGEASCAEESCKGLFDVSNKTTMRNLVLNLPSVLQYHETLFHLKKDTLEFNQCGFQFSTGVNAIQYSLFAVERGTVRVSSLELDSMKFMKSGFTASGDASQFVIENVDLRNISLSRENGFIEIANGGSFTVNEMNANECSTEGSSLIYAGSSCVLRLSMCNWSTCQFTDSGLIKASEANEIHVINCNGSGINLETGDGGLIGGVIAYGGVVVENTTIEDCVAERGNGGGLKLNMRGSAELRISSTSDATSIKRCIAGRTEQGDGSGHGGGLWLGFEGESSRFDLAGMYVEGNKARCGRDVYLVCQDLRKTVTASTFSFYEKITERNNSLMGKDRSKFENDVDLLIFLEGYSSLVIEVDGLTGDNGIWCGMEVCPCASVDYGVCRLADDDEKGITLAGRSAIEQETDLTGVSVETKTNSQIIVIIKSTIGGESDSVIISEGSTLIKNTVLQFPKRFDETKHTLISLTSQNGVLEVQKCIFEMQEESREEIQYSIMRSSGATLIMNWTTIHNIRTAKPILELSLLGAENEESGEPIVGFSNCTFADLSNANTDCAVLFSEDAKNAIKMEQCNMTNVKSIASNTGGAININISGSCLFEVSGCEMKVCAAETSSSGKGGCLFLNNKQAASDISFVFANVHFENNDAFLGKNIFILSNDLNESVTNQTFAFSVDELNDNSNMFVGTDEKRNNTDLLRFLIEYSNSVVVVWEGGDDVARCGSDEDPCKSMWMGLKHIVGDASRKVVEIKEKASVEGSYDLSGLVVEPQGSGGDEVVRSALEIGSKEESAVSVWISNSKTLSLRALDICTYRLRPNGKTGIFESDGEMLEFDDCSLSTNGDEEKMDNAALCFAKKGILRLWKCMITSFEAKQSVFVILSGVQSLFDECDVSQIKDECGSLVKVQDESRDHKNNERNDAGEVVAKNCTFSSVNVEGTDASLICSTCTCGVKVDIESSALEECCAGGSTKGGGILFALNEEGSFKLKNASVRLCGCSASEGKGGGVYLSTRLNGELKFAFDNVTFRRNTAKVGNDVFIECHDIESQINETQFNLDFRDEEFIKQNSIFGMDEVDHKEKALDLMSLIVKYQSDTIVVSSKEGNGGSNEQQCGKPKLPCATIGFGLRHLTHDFFSQLFVDEESIVDEEIVLETLTLRGLQENGSIVIVKGEIKGSEDFVVRTNGKVQLQSLLFVFEIVLQTERTSFLKVDSGKATLNACSFEAGSLLGGSKRSLPFCLLSIDGGECLLNKVNISSLSFECDAAIYIKESIEVNNLVVNNVEVEKDFVQISGNAAVKMENLDVNGVEVCNGRFIAVNRGESKISNGETSSASFSLSLSFIENITCVGEDASVIGIERFDSIAKLSNCSFSRFQAHKTTGSIASLLFCKDIEIKGCLFDGEKQIETDGPHTSNVDPFICEWNGSLVDVVQCESVISDTTFTNSANGGLSARGGTMRIEKGEFVNNNPAIELYPSARRNIWCSDSTKLDMKSVKAGDGVLSDSSLWILNDGCELSGIASERASALFIPVLHEVKSLPISSSATNLTLFGELLLPCNLTLKLCFTSGDEEFIELHEINKDEFSSENEIQTVATSSQLENVREETEVSLCVLFGNADSPSSTQSFILKNKSESKTNGDERIAEGGNEKKKWCVVIVIASAVFILLLAIIVVLAVRWRKVKNENKDLREIVEDNIKKDPKAFEMVTMEMSPEEQWRRAEREAEKKNEERIKKRVFEKSLGHSESSEHLLSESGSTEYILGKGSDKIPQWALEKVEEEEIRKQTPSPSISSTSTTDTSDTDSTFVRSESLCPTTSSMSNLVDAMACSSPHEKLIVDLRDSLFMLLHGRNKTKEMAIGTLQEREQTAAQILFWVANGALHSFDEMENPLQSLASLSPHIVLFSEHMVICIVMHSDFLSSDDDSDSSSISSLTVVSSSSNISVMSERFTDSPPPSSAFEDEDEIRKECLRWKAPELLMNKKMGATKESVSFSIGMMLWECLTLEIPFGEYEGVVAGQKIVNGERPDIEMIRDSNLRECSKECIAVSTEARPTLTSIKRVLIQHFPLGAAVLTMSDAIDMEQCSGDRADSERITDSDSLSTFTS